MRDWLLVGSIVVLMVTGYLMASTWLDRREDEIDELARRDRGRFYDVELEPWEPRVLPTVYDWDERKDFDD